MRLSLSPWLGLLLARLLLAHLLVTLRLSSVVITGSAHGVFGALFTDVRVLVTLNLFVAMNKYSL